MSKGELRLFVASAPWPPHRCDFRQFLNEGSIARAWKIYAKGGCGCVPNVFTIGVGRGCERNMRVRDLHPDVSSRLKDADCGAAGPGEQAKSR